MDLTPPSFNTSPATPEHSFTTSPPCVQDSCCPPDASAASYPSPGLLDFQYKNTSPYPSSIPDDLLTDSSLPSLQTMTHVSWASASEAMAATSPSTSVSSAVANIMPADYDPFGSYEHCLQPPFAPGDVFHAPPPNMSALPRTPPPSTGTSARTPTPVPARTSFGYAQDHEASRNKNEGPSSYSPALEPANYHLGATMHGAYHSDGFSSAHQSYATDSAPTWTKHEFETTQLYSVPPAHISSTSHAPGRSAGTTRPRRASRKHTTREEANFQCEVKGCGKFFSRSYNFKSHMETHDDKREYPFPCPIKDCTKRFVRKTDLQRHHQSVHMKERNHRCDYCARLFARRDTLRRHMEDGCSKRFDIGTLDLRAESYSSMEPLDRPTRPTIGHSVPVTSLLPPLPGTSLSTTLPGGRNAAVPENGPMQGQMWER